MGRLKIDKLGAVEKFELDIKHVNVLIGEQATGKSTICKAIYFFRLVKNEIIKYLFRISTAGYALEQEHFPKALNATVKDIFVQLFGYSWNLPDDLHAEYFFTDEISISVGIGAVKGKKYLQVMYSDALRKKVKKLEEQSFDFYKRQSESLTFSYITSERIQLHNDIQRQMNHIFEDDMETYYIPAGRSMLTLMSRQKTKLDYTALDLVNRNFMQFIENIQPKFDGGIAQAHKYYARQERKFSIDTMVKELQQDLKGDYYYNDGQEYLVLDDSYRIPINFISSGQQEVLWPKLQRKVVDFIIRFANLTGSTVVITTHSPYVLTCMNTLCYAGKIAENENKKEKVDRIVGKHTSVKPGEIYAGKLICEQGHTKVENLIIETEQELYTELIDEVSDINNELYTRLYEVEEQD